MIGADELSDRRALVNGTRRSWIEKLIDTTRRNNLLFFRDLKTGSLDLGDLGSAGVRTLLQGDGVPLERLVAGPDLKKASGILRNIGRRALVNLEEKGLETLFMAVGMASWDPDDGGRPPASPVLLIPTEVRPRSRVGSSFDLRLRGEAQLNPVLAHVLETDYGCHLELSDLLGDGAEDQDADTDEIEPEAVLGRLRALASKVPGFEVIPRTVVGNFSFQKMAMVRDLERYEDQLVANNIIAAMAGEPRARQGFAGNNEEVDPQEFDRGPVAKELLVMDADSSQQRVIETVRRGQSCVIQGPPGTGKSQTIANLIAVLTGEGRRVLFVAEKRAALEVVQRRLEATGLGRLVLDLHGADVARKAIFARVAASLEAVHMTPPVDGQDVEARLEDRRQRLNDYVRALHVKREPTGLSVFDMQGRLLSMTEAVRSTVRWRGSELAGLDVAKAVQIRDLLHEVSGVSGLITGEDPSPWTGATLPDGDTASRAIDAALRVYGLWEEVRKALRTLQGIDSDLRPRHVGDLYDLASLLSGINGSLTLYRQDVWTMDLDDMVTALEPASRSLVSAAWAGITDGHFRSALDAMRRVRVKRRVSARQVLAEARSLRDQHSGWQRLPGHSGDPVVIREADALREAILAFQLALTDLEHFIGMEFWRPDLSIDALTERLSLLAGDSITPHRIPRVLAILKALQDLGVGALVAEIRRRRPVASLWAEMFDFAWLTSSLDDARAKEPVLATFSGKTQDGIIEDFQDLDRKALKVAVARAQRRHAEGVVAAINAHPEQGDLVRHEAQKKTRHKPIRRLLAEAPDVLLALFPCWMASPLSVSQLISGEKPYFDIVLFDEASQVLPQDAAPAILRASHVAVAGDGHQLPPTTFFVDGADEEDESDSTLMSEGFESILDQMSSFLPTRSLDWHYRSLDETLIAFSNHHIYNDQLVTFPGPGGTQMAINHILVPWVPDTDGQEESAGPEVRRVVDLVIEHASKHPDESLGVIAMGIAHAKHVEAALDQALRTQPDLDAFFDPTRRERFFVKNLERVQGDERDAVIITVGYGKDRSGILPHRFGPLNNAGGERRLNVAITRARKRMTVVSSFDHQDVDPSRSKARGVELLRLFLEFAATGGRHLGDTKLTEVPMNPFEEDVFNALAREGIDLVPQLGASRYRLDFGVKDPEKPGKFVLAIECDGATYHSAPTARDRDRLRQQQLEALGWRFHRIWSTDWFVNRDGEIRRAMAAYRKALDPTETRHQAGVTEKPRPAAPEKQSTPHRNPQPHVPRRDKIDDYPMYELVAVVHWILSDGLLRTDDQILDAVVQQLGFQKRGRRIVQAVREAIRLARQSTGG